MSLLLPCASARSCNLLCSPNKGNGGQKEWKFPVPVHHKDFEFLIKKLAPPLTAVLLAVSPICYPPESLGQTLDIQRGATLFNRACIGCHDTGVNKLIFFSFQGATLFTSDLQRNGVDTEEEIYRVTYYGKGRMPGFGEKCTPRGQCTFGPRLQDEEIKLLAEFVKFQADQGWPNVSTD
ncbi:cytochrome c6, chloroplastic isoform X1 [Eutrema salsugineum]|uniref:cytochrome c6, chloroplastic isoform X1 n=1 Tax=Eutrema salsugineum TaxID=72664 RepID=UPI000CECFDF9|nr:cytochrome c6, chloroplastic isoform X1 [Eutrema salsugineum]